jgi:hypothetical protein
MSPATGLPQAEPREGGTDFLQLPIPGAGIFFLCFIKIHAMLQVSSIL